MSLGSTSSRTLAALFAPGVKLFEREKLAALHSLLSDPVVFIVHEGFLIVVGNIARIPLRYFWVSPLHSILGRSPRLCRVPNALIFENEILEMIDDREDYGELRYVALGHVQATVYRVVYIRPDDRTVHIISAWNANKHDQRAYFGKIFTERD